VTSSAPLPDRSPPDWWLTTDKVINKAIELLDEHGEQIFTMRRLGDALGVQAAALYGHVKNKDELLAAALNRTIAELRHRWDPTNAWEDEARNVMVALREHLLAHPWATRLGNVELPQSLFDLGSGVQELMFRAGLREADAYTYRRLLLWTVWGFVAIETGSARSRTHVPIDDGREPARRYRVSIAPADPHEHRRALPEPYDAVDFDELFSAAIDTFVAGVRARVA
jgi:AcrR family transcriptional regulator